MSIPNFIENKNSKKENKNSKKYKKKSKKKEAGYFE